MTPSYHQPGVNLAAQDAELAATKLEKHEYKYGGGGLAGGGAGGIHDKYPPPTGKYGGREGVGERERER